MTYFQIAVLLISITSVVTFVYVPKFVDYLMMRKTGK